MDLDTSLLAVVVDRVTGPTDTGHYLASYVLVHGDEFCGYTKVFLALPADAWSTDAFLKCGGPPRSSPADALYASEKVACKLLCATVPRYDITFGLALAK
jgi:hypothetical protein